MEKYEIEICNIFMILMYISFLTSWRFGIRLMILWLPAVRFGFGFFSSFKPLHVMTFLTVIVPYVLFDRLEHLSHIFISQSTTVFYFS